MNPDVIQDGFESGLGVEATLHTRERYLAAVVEIQQKLLVSQNPRDVYGQALDVLGNASGASRVYVFENHYNSEGKLLTSQKAEWCAAGIEPEIDNPALQNLDFEGYSQRWINVLSRGEIINSFVKNFPENEREILEVQAILSILILPLIVGREFFGFIGFDNCAEERVWDESQVELLRAAAQAFSLAYERNRAEQARRESEERFRELLENANDLIYTISLTGNMLSANKACLRVTGYTDEDVPNLAIEDLIAPEYVDLARSMMTLKIEGKASETVYESMLLTKDGRRVPIEISARLIYRDGKPVAIQGIARDITKRKQIESELLASQERFSKAFSASPVSLVISRLEDGMILDVNETSLEFHGYKREEVIGRKSSDLQVWADPDERAKVATMLLEEGSIRGCEAVLLDKHGNERTVLISAELFTLNGETCALWVSNDITERKHAEEALRLSEERYRSLVAATSQSVWSTDTEGNLKEFKANVEAGRRQTSDVIGWNWLDLVHPEDRERVKKKWQRSVGTGEMYFNEFRILDADANYRCVICRAVPIYGTDGKVREWIGSTTDITEAREAEKALRASEERYRVFVENSSEAIWRIEFEKPCSITLTPEEQIEWVYRHSYLAECNNVMAKMYNFDNMQEIIGVKLSDLLPPSNPANVEYLKNFISSGYRLINAQSEEIDKYGQKKFFLNNLIGIVEDGFITRAWGTQRDVTESHRAEEALRESEERYRIIAETATDAIITVDEESRIFFANRSAERIFGYKVEEMVGQIITMLMPERLREPHRRRLEHYLKTGERNIAWETSEIIVGLHKDGHEIPLENSFGELIKDGKRYFTGIIRDITERKQAEEALQESEEKLRQAQKLEAIGRLAGGVAHDFNNILTGIIGYSDITLHSLASNDPIRRNLEEIRRAADRAAALTHQLLAYSRKQILQPTILDLNEIVLDVNKMLRRLIGEDITLETHLAKNLGRIKADRGQLQQVLMNLVVNARDAMPKGGHLIIKTFNIELREDDRLIKSGLAPGQYVMLTVRDTGRGMTDEIKAKIFEPFFTTKEVGKGTGLGLATVYGIVKQSGGHIIVSSEPEKGATFIIYLPCVKEQSISFDAIVDDQEIKRGVETILLVEDDEVVRTMTCEILETAGYKVLVADNTDHAVDICKEHKETIHLLLTDIVMPKESGRELAEKLLKMCPQMKVLYMSGYTDDDIVSRGAWEKGVKFVQKPYTLDSITRGVREILDA